MLGHRSPRTPSRLPRLAGLVLACAALTPAPAQAAPTRRIACLDGPPALAPAANPAAVATATPGQAAGGAQAQRRPPQQARPRQEPAARTRGAERPNPDASLQDAVQQLIREHVPQAMVDKAKALAHSLPPEQKQRLLSQARQSWARVRPALGDDPERLTALVRNCVALVPEERLDAMLRLVDGALDQGGPGAAAALAELVAKGKTELLPLFMQLLEGQGSTIAERAREPAEQARAWRGLLAALTVNDLLAGPGRETTRESLRALGQDVTVTIDGKPTTLAAWSRRLLEQRFPYLADGPADETPLGTLSAVLVASDLRQLMQELPLVHTPFGAPEPPAAYLAQADPRDDDGIVAALQALATTVRLRESLKTGRDVAVRADDFARLAATEEP